MNAFEIAITVILSFVALWVGMLCYYIIFEKNYNKEQPSSEPTEGNKKQEKKPGEGE